MTHVGASLQTLNQRCEFNMKLLLSGKTSKNIKFLPEVL